VIAPLSANTLAKLAHGLADSVLTEAALAHRGPTVVAPAMNPRMWTNPATQENVALLQERGVVIVGPDEGEMAEGEVGLGRMAEPQAIAARVEDVLRPAEPGALAGKRVLVTAGGTREPLDSVRFIGNRSSGRMGLALAAEARRRGADVTLLSANVALPTPLGVEVVETPTAADLKREVMARADADLVLMTAAVADYRPASPRADKRAKDDSPWTVELEPTDDILAALGAQRTDGQVLVGFAAEHGEGGLARAREKLRAKGADLLVFNDVSRADIGFDSPNNEVVLLRDGDEQTVALTSKEEVAAEILDAAEALLGRNGA
jgi:phosphopantothenoylcysteine decarboxylase/phosphopantothenate--cysteine ligase